MKSPLSRYAVGLLVAWFLLPTTVLSDIRVTDDLGGQVILSQPAQRLVALSPHLAELVFAAGAGGSLVATVDYADYPPEAQRIPRIGSHNRLDVEQLLASRPDLVLVWQSATGADTIDKLRGLGLAVYVSEPRQLSAISRTLRDIGLVSGSSAIAEQAADAFDHKLQQLREYSVKTPQLTMYYQVWDQPLMTINGETLVSKVIELCGATNPFAMLPAMAPVISIEDLVQANPQVIVGAVPVDRQQAWLSAWRNWSGLDAVKEDYIFFINPDLMNRPTPRLLSGAQQLCAQLELVRGRMK